jgi:hypothetical protein
MRKSPAADGDESETQKFPPGRHLCQDAGQNGSDIIAPVLSLLVYVLQHRSLYWLLASQQLLHRALQLPRRTHAITFWAYFASAFSTRSHFPDSAAGFDHTSVSSMCAFSFLHQRVLLIPLATSAIHATSRPTHQPVEVSQPRQLSRRQRRRSTTRMAKISLHDRKMKSR